MRALPFILGCIWLMLSVIGYLLFLPAILFVVLYSSANSSFFTSKSCVLEFLQSKNELLDMLSIKPYEITDSSLNITELKGGYNNRIIKYSIKTSKRTVNFIAKAYKPEGCLFCFLAKYFTPMPINRILPKDRLICEANMLKYLFDARFPVPRVYAVDLDNRVLWMEYIPGETLYMGLQKTDNTSASRIACECGELLSRLHEEGVCLVDTSLCNYIINPQGSISLVDFENSSERGLPEWDVAAFLFHIERLKLKDKINIEKKPFLDENTAGKNLDLKKVADIQEMLKPYRLVSFLDYVIRFER